jgi:hypothetical protein
VNIQQQRRPDALVAEANLSNLIRARSAQLVRTDAHDSTAKQTKGAE